MADEEAAIFKHVSIILLVILSVVTIFTNGTCIYVINKTKELSRTSSSYLIQNLLVVHFIQGLLVFPLYAAKKHGTDSALWNQVICDGFRFTYMMTFYLAVFSVFIITIDRLFAVFLVMRYNEIVNKRRVIYAIIAVWLYVTSLCLLPFRNFYRKPEIGINATSSVPNATLSKTICDYNQSKSWTIFMLSANCLVPYVAIVIIYQLITLQIHKIETRSKGPSTNRVKDANKVKEISKTRTVTKLSMILSVAYLLTWSPSVIYYILWKVCPDSCFSDGYKDSPIESYIGFSTKYLAFLDAAASPFIYCLLNERFRYSIPCLRGAKKQGTDNVTLLTKSEHSPYMTSSDRPRETLCIAETGGKPI